MSNLLLPGSDPSKDGIDDILDFRKPNYEKKYANLTYQSEDTNEIGTIEIRPETTEQDVLDQYVRKFPKEADRYVKEVKEENANLAKLSGMSRGGRMMSLGKIPQILECAMKFVHGEDWGTDKKDWIHFFRRNPKLMVGNHKVKATGSNAIIH